MPKDSGDTIVDIVNHVLAICLKDVANAFASMEAVTASQVKLIMIEIDYGPTQITTKKAGLSPTCWGAV